MAENAHRRANVHCRPTLMHNPLAPRRGAALPDNLPQRAFFLARSPPPARHSSLRRCLSRGAVVSAEQRRRGPPSWDEPVYECVDNLGEHILHNSRHGVPEIMNPQSVRLAVRAAAAHVGNRVNHLSDAPRHRTMPRGSPPLRARSVRPVRQLARSQTGCALPRLSRHQRPRPRARRRVAVGRRVQGECRGAAARARHATRRRCGRPPHQVLPRAAQTSPTLH